MTTYILVLIFGISGWGAGGYQYIEFPSKADCHYALETMRITGQDQTSGEDDEQIISFCKPKDA